MRLTLKSIAAFAAISIVPSTGALAQSVANPIAPTAAITGGGAQAYMAPRTGSLKAVPELSAPASGGNYASTLQIGAFNSVVQAQFGAGNVSNVGIIGGYANNVGVLQVGNNLKSNVGLINTQGLNVGVIQPNGSAPVNVLIARLPGGGLLIAR
jgi:hypothetical protein